MSVVVGAASGECSNCGRVFHSNYPQMVTCDCFEYCPICRQRMAEYVPDLASSTYGRVGVRDLNVIKVCNNLAGHSDHSPYFSYLKPVEVELTRNDV